ncbi:MAG: hypothetical protein D6732_09440 [Methanobacteriota archaeon]|nr:MAG: hypothetical protein D6732_09440 [Euryarchaeota archaeon]
MKLLEISVNYFKVFYTDGYGRSLEYPSYFLSGDANGKTVFVYEECTDEHIPYEYMENFYRLLESLGLDKEDPNFDSAIGRRILAYTCPYKRDNIEYIKLLSVRDLKEGVDLDTAIKDYKKSLYIIHILVKDNLGKFVLVKNKFSGKLDFIKFVVDTQIGCSSDFEYRLSECGFPAIFYRFTVLYSNMIDDIQHIWCHAECSYPLEYEHYYDNNQYEVVTLSDKTLLKRFSHIEYFISDIYPNFCKQEAYKLIGLCGQESVYKGIFGKSPSLLQYADQLLDFVSESIPDIVYRAASNFAAQFGGSK